jgi:uncharacterized protein (TIGR02145 family)
MKRFLAIIFFLASINLSGQSVSIFDIDTTDFPLMKAKFYAFDSEGNQVVDFQESNLKIREDGLERQIVRIFCPEPKPLEPVSVALSVDISFSMRYSRFGGVPIEYGRLTAVSLIEQLAMPPSEMALQICSNYPVVLTDFTTDKSKLTSLIPKIEIAGDNDFEYHLMDSAGGILKIARRGNYKKVAIVFTDAWWDSLSYDFLAECIQICRLRDIEFYGVFYSEPEGEPDGIKKSFHKLARASGGEIFDGITSYKSAEELANNIQKIIQGGEPCEIEWIGGVSCNTSNLIKELEIVFEGENNIKKYKPPNGAIAEITAIPSTVKFIEPEIGVPVDTTILVTATNADFNVTKVTSSNKSFSVEPNSFFLPAGDSIELKVTYLPLDSGYTLSEFKFENNQCPGRFFASGGWPGKLPAVRTLKLIHPNGGEVFVAGSDTVITWEGVAPDERVVVEYRKDDSSPWIMVTDSAVGLSHTFRIPNIESDNFLARVTVENEFGNCPPTGIDVCGKVWMACNLDVETYRNGDTILHCKTREEWVDAANRGEGAWCYYDNYTKNNKIYGKLYNGYAIDDPRGLAPEGWRIPLESEIIELEKCLEIDQGSKLAGWKNEWSPGQLVKSDFFGETFLNLPPGGWRYSDGLLSNLHYYGKWWGRVQNSYDFPQLSYFTINSKITKIEYGRIIGNSKGEGNSVRCIKDE